MKVNLRHVDLAVDLALGAPRHVGTAEVIAALDAVHVWQSDARRAIEHALETGRLVYDSRMHLVSPGFSGPCREPERCPCGRVR